MKTLIAVLLLLLPSYCAGAKILVSVEHDGSDAVGKTIATRLQYELFTSSRVHVSTKEHAQQTARKILELMDKGTIEAYFGKE